MPPDFTPSAGRLSALLPIASRADIGMATPCERYALRDLVAHILGLTLAFRASAEKDFGPYTDTDPNAGLPPLHEGWAATISTQLDEMVAAWQRPQSWVGMTRAGGADLPASVMGVVALNEITLHGWDVAVTLGQSYVCDDATALTCLGFVEQAAQSGGALFGPPRPVPADAPVFHRLLAGSGRDPGWAAPVS